MDTVQKNLKLLSWIIYLLLIIVGSSPFLYFLLPPSLRFFPPHDILTRYGGVEQLELWQQVLGIIVASWPAGLLCWAFIIVLQLIKLLREGLWFDQKCETLCQRFSRVMLWFVIAQIFHRTLLVLVITATYPAGQKQLSFGLSSADLFALLPAIFALIFSHIVSLARQQRDELNKII